MNHTIEVLKEPKTFRILRLRHRSRIFWHRIEKLLLKNNKSRILSVLGPSRIVKDAPSNSSRKQVKSCFSTFCFTLENLYLEQRSLNVSKCVKSEVLLPSKSPKHILDMTCTIYFGIFQTSTRYADFFSDKPQIYRQFFRPELDMSTFLDKYKICGNLIYKRRGP